ncbi:MAG TPA: glycosyltransferase, partial [Blastocatellia bacterium]|nr:glycosyltransferase [Blastocatellia bacterium]
RQRPNNIGSRDKFTFLYLGAVNERKGTDLLLKAYFDEFTASDQVRLIIKEAFRHPAYANWAAQLEEQYRGISGPELIWIHEDSVSVNGYFTASDIGVFPHRGEGFGLPILECLSSGRRVIVSHGSGPNDFCGKTNSYRIQTSRVVTQGCIELEPDTRDLQRLMRQAFNAGKPTQRDSEVVSKSVENRTWDKTIARLESAIKTHLSTRKENLSRQRSNKLNVGRPVAAYTYFELGQTSWRKYSLELDRALSQSNFEYQSFSYLDCLKFDHVDLLIGQSEHCLEGLLRTARLNPQALKIVHQECTVLGDRVRILNQERELCGLEPVPLTPLNYWRNHKENSLADYILVASTVAHRFFSNNEFPPEKIRIIPYGLSIANAIRKSAKGRKIRFLFIGTDPFRKGVRLLFEAWDRAKLKNAELVCLSDLEILRSPLLLTYLIRNPNITVKQFVSRKALAEEYDQADCQVLPSLEDTFSVAVGDGMGRGLPAIVSTNTGIQDLITHKHDGYIVQSGVVQELTEALNYFAQSRTQARRMGEAAYETAKRYTWQHFRRNVLQTINDLWQNWRS